MYSAVYCGERAKVNATLEKILFVYDLIFQCVCIGCLFLTIFIDYSDYVNMG